MTLSVPITPEVEAKLRQRATSAGKAPETYAAEVLARDVARPSFDEILAPVREDFAQTGMSDDQIMQLGRRELDSLRAEKTSKSS